MSQEFWITLLTFLTTLAVGWQARRAEKHSQKNGEGIKEINILVNGQKAALIAEIASLKEEVAALKRRP